MWLYCTCSISWYIISDPTSASPPYPMQSRRIYRTHVPSVTWADALTRRAIWSVQWMHFERTSIVLHHTSLHFCEVFRVPRQNLNRFSLKYLFAIIILIALGVLHLTDLLRCFTAVFGRHFPAFSNTLILDGELNWPTGKRHDYLYPNEPSCPSRLCSQNRETSEPWNWNFITPSSWTVCQRQGKSLTAQKVVIGYDWLSIAATKISPVSLYQLLCVRSECMTVSVIQKRTFLTVVFLPLFVLH